MSDPTATLPHARRIPATRLPCHLFDSNAELARQTARLVADVVRRRAAEGLQTVLVLSAGSTPTGVYRELVRLHCEEGVDFSSVVVFNVDEYYPIGEGLLQGRGRWLREHFLDALEIPASQLRLLDGGIPREQIGDYCRRIDDEIRRLGGVDIAILGFGRNGHLGGNESLSPPDSGARVVTIDPVTRKGLASDFFGEANVPHEVVTLGMNALLGARKVLLLALGEHKAKIVRTVAEEPKTERIPASLLQGHPDAALVVDAAAGKDLTGAVTPWLVGSVEWTEPLIKRAVLWLCEKTGKGCLKLDDRDFRDHQLDELLRHHGPSERLAQMVFSWMMKTIEYHPGGAEKGRVICFSPHPDDDVISMGGALIRLNQDGHEVHVAYMTSGNIAVFDHDAQRMADFVSDFNRMFGIDCPKSEQLRRDVEAWFARKKPGEPDIEAVQKIKGLIRQSEAKYGALEVGCKADHLHYLDMPFYQTGTIAKKALGPDDVRIVRELIERVAPRQIYVAGDLSDPHGTHRVCAEAIFRALIELRNEGRPVPETLLYRGAWQEYDLHEIEIAMPMSPSDLALKRQAIFMHESQKDDALFPGSDPRQFWQRAEDRNHDTARRYHRIGLPDFYAIEAFVRWDGVPI